MVIRVGVSSREDSGGTILIWPEWTTPPARLSRILEDGQDEQRQREVGKGALKCSLESRASVVGHAGGACPVRSMRRAQLNLPSRLPTPNLSSAGPADSRRHSKAAGYKRTYSESGHVQNAE